ncbi:enoyl-CoA hydratase/isomerase family protein [Salsipaludibacter albus]|uniref:enoyl-CoA hydratase/isomerase family protein n=1 Tax=Salsipaludibacter albus TaxID=2849650 RepID=UPI001EE47846|nr:enoyl-CoA hydratase/isomerase family protein [Salsipaludibacter albus]MBY5163230.1 enoyl-CoA hydratase/isomerase family protein [Salsipaludibacter albus]
MSTTPTGDVVTFDLRDGVAEVVIDRPATRNAMDWDVFSGLAEAADRAAADPDVGAVLVSGADGAFSSGLDVGLFAAGGPDGVDAAFVHRLQAVFDRFEDLEKPTVAALSGPCLGAGAQLAAACHLRVVTADVRIAIAERRWGLVPDLGGTYRLPRLVGLGRAHDWVMTGREVGAEEAVASGFAQGRVADLDGARTLAVDLARAPGATRRVPALLRDNLGRSRDAALAAEAEAQIACMAGPDVAEAVAAAREGRPPRFVGR